MTELAWVLSAWAVVGGGIVVWFGDALAVLEGPRGGGRTGAPARAAGTTRSPTSRRAGNACTQCPCAGFRRTC